MSEYTKREVTKLADGFAYCEVKSVFNKTVDMKPMIDKNGEPMILITWDVVDKNGNTGLIRSYISSKVRSVIVNLENALQLNTGLYSERTKQFDISLIIDRCCAATIAFNEEWGSQIKKYIPLEFFNYVNSKADPQEEASQNQTDSYKKDVTYSGVRKSDVQRLLDEQGVKFQDNFTPDNDIPF